MIIRRATAADEPRMREVARASKGHWGYDSDRLRKWSEQLEYPTHCQHWVAVWDGAIAAYASLVPPGDGVCELDDLWVDAPFIGQGIGSVLFAHAAEHARVLGARAMRIESDPNALGFYQRKGAQVIGSRTSSWGRELPLLELELV